MTIVMCDMFFFFLQDSSWTRAIHEPQSDAAFQVRHARCGCRSGWHVNQLRLRRRVWHGRVVLAFVVGLFCHRPHRRTLLSWVWCDVPGEEIIAGMERRGLFDCIPESSVVVGTQLAPSRAPDLALGQDVRDCAHVPLPLSATTAATSSSAIVGKCEQGGKQSINQKVF